jgi:hypothetical protein
MCCTTHPLSVDEDLKRSGNLRGVGSQVN